MGQQLVVRPQVNQLAANLVQVINLDGTFFNSSYLLLQEDAVIIIDPAFNAQALIEYIEAHELSLVGVLLTHGHWDHVHDLGLIVHHFNNVPIYCHQADQCLVELAQVSGQKFFNNLTFPYWDLVNITYLEFPEFMHLGDFKIQTLSTPGHTAGSVCFQYQQLVFSGDHVFFQDVGNTTSMNSSKIAMVESLTTFLTTYDDHMFINPGHGKSFLLGQSRAQLMSINNQLRLMNE